MHFDTKLTHSLLFAHVLQDELVGELKQQPPDVKFKDADFSGAAILGNVPIRYERRREVVFAECPGS